MLYYFPYQDIIESCMVKRSYSMSFVFFQYPTETYGYALLFSLSGYLGLYIVLTLVKSFGALIAVTGKLVLYSSFFHFIYPLEKGEIQCICNTSHYNMDLYITRSCCGP